MQSEKTVIQSRCLEWHLGDEVIRKPRRVLCGLVVRQASLLDYFNRLAVALAKSQDHRASCGVFAFGLRNAVRRWLRLRYPAARASQGRDGGRNPRAGWLKKSRITQRRLAPYEGQLKRRANFDIDHGKATLCSSIHHRGSKSADHKRVDRSNQRRAGLDQRAAEPTWHLVQGVSLCRQVNTRSGGLLPRALPWIPRDTAVCQRLQGLGITQRESTALDLTGHRVYDAGVYDKGTHHG